MVFGSVTMAFNVRAQNPEGFEEMLDKMYKNTVPFIFPEQLAFEIKRTDNLYILDTRERKEYMVSHIKGAKYVSYKRFDIKSMQDIPKDHKIVVYCSIGYRSERIGEKLLNAGYENVFNLYGGFFNWMNNGYQGVNMMDKETKTVHGFNKSWAKWINESVCKSVY